VRWKEDGREGRDNAESERATRRRRPMDSAKATKGGGVRNGKGLKHRVARRAPAPRASRQTVGKRPVVFPSTITSSTSSIPPSLLDILTSHVSASWSRRPRITFGRRASQLSTSNVNVRPWTGNLSGRSSRAASGGRREEEAGSARREALTAWTIGSLGSSKYGRYTSGSRADRSSGPSSARPRLVSSAPLTKPMNRL
jgi:hypothetical protein